MKTEKDIWQKTKFKKQLTKLPLDGSHVGNSGLVRYFTVQKETDEIKQQTSGDHNNRCPC